MWTRSLCCFLLVCSACHTERRPTEDLSGDVTIRLALAPNDARCLRLVAVGGGEPVVKTFAIPVNSPVNARFASLPTGTVRVSAKAYAESCERVTAATAPTWTSTPESWSTQIPRGEPSTLAVTLHPKGLTNTESEWKEGVSPAPPPPGRNTESILASKSTSCLSCARAKCGSAQGYYSCEDPISDLTLVADAGPAAGTSRRELCLDTLECIVKSGCAGLDPVRCYCGDGVEGTECLAGNQQNGACKAAQERGMESTDPAKIALNYVDTQLGGGRANALVLCLSESKCPCLR